MPFGDVIILLSSDDDPPSSISTLPGKQRPQPPAPASDPLHSDGSLVDLLELDAKSLDHPTKRRRVATLDDEKEKLPRKEALIENITDNFNDFEDDPIVFTSSANDHANASRVARKYVPKRSLNISFSDDDLPEDPLPAIAAPTYSAGTAAVLASLHKSSKTLIKGTLLKESTGNARKVHKDISVKSATLKADKPVAGRVASPVRKRKRILLNEEQENRNEARTRIKEAKAQERALIKAQKAQEKEEAKALRRKDAEEKARQKRAEAELAEVNRSKVNKDESVKEMIVDLPRSIEGDTFDFQARKFFENLGVETSTYDSPVPNVIKWRRRTKRRWNPELERWQALPDLVIEQEKHVLCLMPAKELARLATAPESTGNLETHVAQLRSAYPNCSPIYMIEGLADLLRKSKNAENRIFNAHVLNTAPAQARSRKRTEEAIVDKPAIEAALLRLQVVGGCYIHHTDVPFHSARWLMSFTAHISLIPHQFQAMNRDTTFCMDNGQIKSGENKADTFVKMLQETFRVTPAIALGIAAVYPSVTELVKEGLEKRGPLCLEDIRKCANRNGAFTDSRVGPSISRRLCKVFLERDPDSTNV